MTVAWLLQKGNHLQAQEDRMTFSSPILPWYGFNYEAKPTGVGLLLIGESMYTNQQGHYPADMLQRLIRQQADGTNHWTFYDRVYHTVTGHRRTQSERATILSFWERVALYNYVQSPVIGGPRTRPSSQMWTEARGFVSDVFNTLKPDRAVVFGLQLWRELVDSGFCRPSSCHGFGQLATNAHHCASAYVYHPASFGFSARLWHAERVVPLLRSTPF